MSKKVLVACGTGICTSTTVKNKLADILKEEGHSDLAFDQCKVSEVASKASSFDLVVATTDVPGKVETPIVKGTPFLTGIGVDSTVEEIKKHLGL